MELQERIERFLNNEMTESEKFAFEEEINSNEELARQVAYNKDLQGFFDTQYEAVDQSLTALGDKHFNQQNRSIFKNKWLIIIPTLLFVLLGGYFIVSNFLANSGNEHPAPADEFIITDPNESNPNKSNTNDNDEVDEAQPNEAQPEINQPIASLNPEDFKPNPALEKLMRESVRSDGETVISLPIRGKVFKYQNTIHFQVKGKSQVQPPYQLIIYANKINDFKNDAYLLNKTLTHLKFDAHIALKKGLYYLVIQEKESEQVIYISSFSVK